MNDYKHDKGGTKHHYLHNIHTWACPNNCIAPKAPSISHAVWISLLLVYKNQNRQQRTIINIIAKQKICLEVYKRPVEMISRIQEGNHLAAISGTVLAAI